MKQTTERQGVDIAKPDVHVRRVAEAAWVLLGQRSWRRVCTRLTYDRRTAERHLRSSGAQVPAVDPVHNQAAIFLRRLLPRKVTGIEGVNLAVGHKLVEVL